MKKKGFTLIELITSIVIISLVLILAIPVYNAVTGKTKKKAYENKVKLVEVAAANYAYGFKNEIAASPEIICVEINTLIKENQLISDGKNQLYLTNPNPGGVEPGEQLRGIVELSYLNDELVATYKLDGVCSVMIAPIDDSEDKYLVDLEPPTGNMYIQEGDYTNQTTIHLNLTLLDLDAIEYCYKDTPAGVCTVYHLLSPYVVASTGGLEYIIPYNLVNSVNGTHHVYLWLRDKYHNVSVSYHDQIVYDDVDPTGAMVIDGNVPYTNNASSIVTLTMTYADNLSGVSAMCISDTSICPAANWQGILNTRSWTLPGPDGENTVHIWFRDRSGNISNEYTDSIILDRVRPTDGSVTINDDSILDGAQYIVTNLYTLSISSTDVTSLLGLMCVSQTPVCSVWIPYSDSYNSNANSNNFLNPDGLKTIYIQFRDNAGNQSANQVSDDITMDRTSPINNTITYSNAYITTTSHNLTFSSQDPISGIMRYTVYARYATLSNNVCGAFGSWSSSGIQTSPYTATVSTARCYQYYVVTRNNAGLESQTSNVSPAYTTKVDTTNPTSVVTSYTDGYVTTTSQNVTFSSVDLQSLIASNTLYRRRASLSVGTCGSYGSWSNLGVQTSAYSSTVTNGYCYQYYIIALNNAGLTTDSAVTQTSKIDTTGPTAPTINVSETWINAASVNGTIVSNSTDPESPIDRYQYSMSGATTQAWTDGNSFTVVNQGETIVSARAINDAGLSGAISSKTVRIDRTVPTCVASASGTLGNNSWYTSDVVLSAVGSDTLSQVKSITPAATLTTDTASYTKTFTVTDNVDLTNTCTITVKKDETNPTCDTSIVSGTLGNFGWYTSTVTFSATGSDSMSGISSNPANQSISTDTAGASRTFTVYDKAGNSGSCTSVTIKRDATAPNCTISGESTTWKSGTRIIYRQCVDPNYPSPGSGSGCIVVSQSENFSSTATTASTTAYNIVDYAGNTKTCPSVTVNVYVDNTDPSCSIAFTACSASGTGTCTDSNSGVKTGASASITANTTMSHSCEDNVGNTSSCSITKTYDACCTGSVVCVPGYKTCTNTTCCGTYCSSYGNTYECYQLTGGYGCGKKCASSTPTSEGQIWYKTTESCCLSSEAATCTKECCGTDPCLTTTNSCIAGYK